MLAVAYVALVAILAYQLRTRVHLLEGFAGVFRYLLALGLTLFLVDWADFLLYVAFGWGRLYLLASWLALLGPVLFFSAAPGPASGAPAAPPVLARVRATLSSRWNWWFLLIFSFVIVRFFIGLDSDENNLLWSTFNFDDTAFHLSVANSLLNSPRFPPMDLDMAPYPLKYHFLADFWLAHLQRLGMRAVHAVIAMNCLSAAVMIGSLWAMFRKWLGLSSRWTLLACVIFLFLNTSLVNVIHYLLFKPPYLNPAAPADGLLFYPYFNFESSLIEMFSPQRGLLFTFPVGLLVLDAIFGGSGDLPPGRAVAAAPVKTLQAVVLVCLLPLSHVVTFAVLGGMLVPRLWEHGRWLGPRVAVWLPAAALLALQLLYLAAYGPSANPNFSSWNVSAALPLNEFAAVPALFRRVVFWFFIDGDFLFWGCLFAVAAMIGRRRPRPVAPPARLRAFLGRWRWYFAVCGLAFLGVNVYRYSFDWGDSNKFVLYLNLGLTMVIVLGVAELDGRLGRVLSRALVLFFCALCMGPPLYRLGASVLAAPYGSIILFHSSDRAAARWLRTSTRSSEMVLTGASDPVHFVTALGARPVPAGIYSDSNPYWREERAEEIRRVYEDGDLGPIRRLGVRYVCVSRFERLRYRLNPCWRAFRRLPGVVAFHAGDPGDATAVYIFDARRLLQAVAPAPGGAGADSVESHGPPRPAGG